MISTVGVIYSIYMINYNKQFKYNLHYCQLQDWYRLEQLRNNNVEISEEDLRNRKAGKLVYKLWCDDYYKLAINPIHKIEHSLYHRYIGSVPPYETG